MTVWKRRPLARDVPYVQIGSSPFVHSDPAVLQEALDLAQAEQWWLWFGIMWRQIGRNYAYECGIEESK